MLLGLAELHQRSYTLDHDTIKAILELVSQKYKPITTAVGIILHGRHNQFMEQETLYMYNLAIITD